MVDALIFDLDGTLVQTEQLKAKSYARAAVELDPSLDEDAIVEAFKEVVGKSRREVATSLMNRFDLEEAARSRMEEFGVHQPWQAYVQVRLKIYDAMFDDPETILGHRWPHSVELLECARRHGCPTALATMSHCDRARRILEILELEDAFDFVATRDDVESAKPSPEIYQLVARELDVEPQSCVVIEDSPAGVKAALAAEMQVIALATPFTRERLHKEQLVPPHRIADDPDHLLEVVQRELGVDLSCD